MPDSVGDSGPRDLPAQSVRARQSGLQRLSQEVRDGRDRFVASDPGWTRLRQAVCAIVAVGTTLLVEWGVARLAGRDPLLGMLLGAVVAMLMSTGIRDANRRSIAVTAAAAPVAAAAGAALGILTAGQHLLGLGTFVVVSFVAVWIRRLGPRWFTLGFLFWQGFFFALLLHPPPTSLPFLLLAIGVSGVWVAALLLTVFYDDPAARLLRTVTALRARARSGIAAAVDVLDEPGDQRSVRQVRAHLLQLSEIALLLDGQLADPRALPEGVSAGRIRRWAVDFEIAMDEVAGATVDIAAHRAQVSAQTIASVRQMLEALGWADPDVALLAAHRLDDSDANGVPAVRRLGSAALFLLETVRRWDTGELRTPPGPGMTDSLDEETDFEAVVTLVSGNLPGSAVLAQRSNDRPGSGRFSPSRISLTTRQAVQAAVAAGLAIVAGEAISAQRFYWAVIAAFVAFAGTATSGETLRKGAGRIAGTVLGLLAAVGLADLTDGRHPVAIATILVCVFLAFFVQALSYGLMVFFITVMLGQLYTLLGTFSDELLLVRLAETVAGAAIGVVVSLVVLPTHSRATLRVARQSFLDALGELLEGCAATLAGQLPARHLLTLTVQLDAAGRQLVRTRRALTKGRLFGADREGLRHRITVLGACGSAARAVAAAISTDRPDAALSEAARQLAAQARRLSAAPALGRAVAAPAGEVAALQRVRSLLAEVPERNTAALHALRRLNEALALLGPRALVERSS